MFSAKNSFTSIIFEVINWAIETEFTFESELIYYINNTFVIFFASNIQHFTSNMMLSHYTKRSGPLYLILQVEFDS